MSFAQIKSGIVKYEMITSMGNLGKMGDKEVPESILAMFPKEVKKNKQLIFNETESLFENSIAKKSNEEDEPQENNGVTIKMNFIGGGDGEKEKTYINHLQNKKVESKSFFGKDFLVINDSINKVQWKPTGKQKIMLNYPCYEAITMANVNGKQDTVTAWYTPAISTQAGPMGYFGLPGMILQLQLGPNLSFTATEIIEKQVSKNELQKPTNGKQVTAAEFKVIQDEKLKEMGMEKGKPKVIFHSSTNME